jgi:hypothetical protein
MNVWSLAMPIVLIDPSKFPPDQGLDLASINVTLQEVASFRKPTISALDEPYCRSKIAWKVASYSNGILYRFVALASGVAQSINSRNVLSAILNARSLVETSAVYWSFGERIEQLIGAKDFPGLDSLAMNYLFGTRDEETLATNPELKAAQVLTAIDKIDKAFIPHFRSHYDRLSERCHPNAAGHREIFSKLHHDSHLVEFIEAPDPETLIIPIKCALGTAIIAKMTADKVSLIVSAIADAHHQAHPSPLAS